MQCPQALAVPALTTPTPQIPPRNLQLISEAYDVLKTVGGLSNDELAAVFDKWNKVGQGCAVGRGRGGAQWTHEWNGVGQGSGAGRGAGWVPPAASPDQV